MAFDLCVVKKAEHPFLIESVQIRVWTIEELCFFLQRNIWLIDQSVVCLPLAEWVGDELGMKGLRHRLEDALERPDRDITYFVMPIFAEIGYLSPDEQRRVRKQLMEVQVRPEEESQKLKADYLVRCGKLSAAETMYRKILRDSSQGKMKTSFLESVWNNLGCAYAREFRFREAADCFYFGYSLGQSRELLRKYISVIALSDRPEAYQEKLREIGADTVFTKRTQEMNARLAQDLSERISVRTRPDENVRESAEQLFETYRREES